MKTAPIPGQEPTSGPASGLTGLPKSGALRLGETVRPANNVQKCPVVGHSKLTRASSKSSPYLPHCASVGVKPHPARFPEKLPTFFIEFLTDPGDTVLDIFAGSNTTGSAAEKLDRHWLAFEKDSSYLAASAFRFVAELPAEGLAALWGRLHSDDMPVEVNRQQRELVLREAPVPFTAKRRRQKRTRQQKSP